MKRASAENFQILKDIFGVPLSYFYEDVDDEAGREEHLNGKVAAALMEKIKAGDLFAKTPEIYKLDIIADKSAK